MSFSAKMMNLGMRKVYDYLEKDPKTNLPKLMEMVDKVLPESVYAPQRKVFREILENQDNNWFELIESVWTDIDPQIIRKFFENFIMNANLDWAEKREKVMEEYHCNVPWAILLDPTSACNMHCTGCWAAEYGNRLNLSFDEIDSIITQGKELGVYMYIYTGGEPLMRKQDLIALCNKHSDCEFLAFTNATLIDEEFADEMLRVKNFIPAISVEGSEEDTDSRRGKGSYQRVVRAMEILRRKKLPFGVSCCYTSQNLDSISSEEFIDQLVSWEQNLRGSSTICRLEMMRLRSCCHLHSRENRCIIGFVSTAAPNRSLPLIFRMMVSMWEDASQAEEIICTSIQTAILNRASLSIIRIPISAKNFAGSTDLTAVHGIS